MRLAHCSHVHSVFPSSKRRGDGASMSSLPPAAHRATGPRVADLQLRGSAGPVRTRVAWPRSAGGPTPPPLLVFLPAAGDHDPGPTVSELAGVVVLEVTDTRPPRLPDAAALLQATTATQWAADHAAELDADARRVLVGGEGRGAWLAAAVALQARDDGWPTLTRQVLVGPAATESEGGSAVTRLVSSRRVPSLVGVAPATVLAIGEGSRGVDIRGYVSRLRDAGVDVDDLPDRDPTASIAPRLASALRRAVGEDGGRPA
jgi:alpha/beta hydrolase fold